MEILYFNSRVQRFVESIEKPFRPRTTRVLELLAKHGSALGMPCSKALGKGLFELRIIGVLHIRLLYAFHRDAIWLLHGFTKKTERIPGRDLEYARGQLKRLAEI